MDTGLQDEQLALKFGLPYVLLRKPKPYDTTVLNYNWQVFETQAFSIYSGVTDTINKESAQITWLSILRFLANTSIIHHHLHLGSNSHILRDEELETILSSQSGILHSLRGVGEPIKEGDLLAKILDPFTGETRSSILAPTDGTIFFAHEKPLVHQNTLLFQLVKFH